MANNGKTKKRGRPPTGGRDPLVTLRLPEKVLGFVDRQARSAGISRSEMIRIMLEETGLGFPPGLQRSRIAYHEAGHAVIARVMKLEIKKATVRRNKRFEGHVIHTNYWAIGGERHARTWILPRHKLEIQSAHANIIVLFAGRCAEHMIGYPSNDGEKNDNAKIKKIASQNDIGAEQLGRLRNFTKTLVWRHADAIQKIANWLIDRETIGAAEIEKAIVSTKKRSARPHNPLLFGFRETDTIRYLA